MAVALARGDGTGAARACCRFGLIAVSILFLSGITFSAHAEAGAGRAIGPSAALPPEVKPTTVRTIIVADYYPYTYIDKDGRASGFTVDLMQEVAEVMGLGLEIRADTWDVALQALKDGRIDFLPMMAYSKERDLGFDFSPAHTIAYDALFARKGEAAPRTLEDLRGKRVVVLLNDLAHQYLKGSGMFDPAFLLPMPTMPDLLRALASGKGDVAIMPKLVGLLLARNLGLTNIGTAPAIVDAYTRPFSFAVKEGNAILLDRLSQGLAILKSTGRYNAIYRKWFGIIEPAGLSPATVFKYIGGVVAFFLVAGAILLLWTFSLRRQVAARTGKLVEEIGMRKRIEEELNRNEEKLLLSLSEKEVLLREVHHRVKNNLSIISSLLDLQTSVIQTPTEALLAFQYTRDRIMAMALVHDELYKTKDYAHVDMGAYLDRLAKQILEAYEASDRISLTTRAEDIKLSVSASIPLGLIVNEIVTNSLRHAFPEDRSGQIEILLGHSEGGFYELDVRDDGIGLPKSLKAEESPSLGLTLVRLLVAQIDGSLVFAEGGGTRFRMNFPNPYERTAS
ncbi:MAG: transporter substrate-binding domain-containing protein [Spirochaetota bacterium]